MQGLRHILKTSLSKFTCQVYTKASTLSPSESVSITQLIIRVIQSYITEPAQHPTLIN